MKITTTGKRVIVPRLFLNSPTTRSRKRRHSQISLKSLNQQQLQRPADRGMGKGGWLLPIGLPLLFVERGWEFWGICHIRPETTKINPHTFCSALSTATHTERLIIGIYVQHMEMSSLSLTTLLHIDQEDVECWIGRRKRWIDWWDCSGVSVLHKNGRETPLDN